MRKENSQWNVINNIDGEGIRKIKLRGRIFPVHTLQSLMTTISCYFLKQIYIFGDQKFF